MAAAMVDSNQSNDWASDVDECAGITRWLGELPSGGTPWLGQKPRRTVSWSGGIQPQHRNLHDFAELDLDQHITHAVDQGSSFFFFLRAAYLPLQLSTGSSGLLSSALWRNIKRFLVVNLKYFACLRVNVHIVRCWLWSQSKQCSYSFFFF